LQGGRILQKETILVETNLLTQPARKGISGRSGGTMPKLTRVILADDHDAVRAGIRCILQSEKGIEVVGEARNGAEAIQLVNQLKPDVLLLDMEMPVLNGIEVARRLQNESSPVHILALSSYDDSHYILELLANGASGYLTKDEAPEYIVHAVQRVAKGEHGCFSKRAAARLRKTTLQEKELDL
jgi:DNA-binding NarL/FixJ family response regulator